METLPELGSLSDDELRELIETLSAEEREISYRRRLLHGRIDIMRAELATREQRRGVAAPDPGDGQAFDAGPAES